MILGTPARQATRSVGTGIEAGAGYGLWALQQNLERLRAALSALSAHQALLIVAAIALLGAVLRAYHLGYKSLWLDEAVLYWISQGSPGEIVAENAELNSAPPLFAFLVGLVSRLGDAEAVLRLPSSLAGVAAIPAVYLLARQFLPRGAAYFTAFIVAVAPSQVQYSQQVREYSVAFLLATLLLLFFTRYLREHRWSDWAALTAIGALGIFTQYGLAILAFALGVLMAADAVLRPDRALLVSRWAGTQIALLSAVVAVYHLALGRQLAPGGFASDTYLANAYLEDGSLRSLAEMAVTNTRELLDFSFPETTLFLFILGTGVIAAVWSRSGRMALLMLALPALLTFLAAAADLYPYHGGRQDIFLTVMVYILAGFGAHQLLRTEWRRPVLILLVLLLAVSGLGHTRTYLNERGPEDLRPVTATLGASVQPGDRVYVYYGASPSFRYYMREGTQPWIEGVTSRSRPDAYLTQLDEVLSQEGPVWMVLSHCYRRECELITRYASQLRRVEVATAEAGATLLLAH